MCAHESDQNPNLILARIWFICRLYGGFGNRFHKYVACVQLDAYTLFCFTPSCGPLTTNIAYAVKSEFNVSWL